MKKGDFVSFSPARGDISHAIVREVNETTAIIYDPFYDVESALGIEKLHPTSERDLGQEVLHWKLAGTVKSVLESCK